MRIHLINFTDSGSKVNQKLCKELSRLGYDCEGYAMERFLKSKDLYPLQESLHQWTKRAFSNCEAIIYIGACGIAVRAIAPFIEDKFSDPGVITMDEKAEYIIPLLSGHVGGSNELARKIASITGGIPVISTATDINQVFAVDIFAKENRLFITDRQLAKRISADLLEGQEIFLESELPIDGNLPNGIVTNLKDTKDDRLKIHITVHKNLVDQQRTLELIPKVTCLGIGCKKKTGKEELEVFVLEQLKAQNISFESVRSLASINLKKEEEALIYLTEKYKWDFITYSAEELEQVQGNFHESDFVQSVTGVGNVCERAAVLSSRNQNLMVSKMAKQGMTLAIALMNRRLSFE